MARRLWLLLFAFAGCVNTSEEKTNTTPDALVSDTTTVLPAVPICVYNGDSVVSTRPQGGYLYIKKYEQSGAIDPVVAENVELTLFCKGYHTCHSHCIYYDSIADINIPGLQALKGQLIATIFKDEDTFREKAGEFMNDKMGEYLHKQAKGKIIHRSVDNDAYSHHGLLFIEQ